MVRLPLHVPEQGETDVRRNNAKRRGGENGVNLKADGTSSGVRLLAQTGGEDCFSFVCLNYQEKGGSKKREVRGRAEKKKGRSIGPKGRHEPGKSVFIVHEERRWSVTTWRGGGIALQ